MKHSTLIRYGLAFAIAVLIVEAAAAGGGREAGGMISPREAQELVESGGAVLVDVRDEASYVDIHIAGALHAPLGEVSARADEFARDGRTVIAYCSCPAEETSLAAAGNLIAAGFTDVLVLEGGIRAWSDAGLPLRRGPRP